MANAIWSGTDAVMLSEETSIGVDPSNAVRTMAKIAARAEEDLPYLQNPIKKYDTDNREVQILCEAATLIADELGAKAIVAPTRSGRTPLYISKMRSRAPVYALCDNERIVRQMNLYWGVKPITIPRFATVDALLDHAGKTMLKSGAIKAGDIIVTVSGAHGRKHNTTRLLEIRRV